MDSAGTLGQPRLWTPVVSRRSLLRHAAEAATASLALTTAGCSRVGRMNAPAAARLVTFEIGSSWLGDIPGLLQGYVQANPRVRFWVRPNGVSATVPKHSPFVVTSTKARQFPYSYLTYGGNFAAWDLAPLDPVLRSHNFNPALVLPGLIDGFTYGAQIYALPTFLAPAVVAYRRDAFDAAGLAAPAPEWTLEDFEKTCTVLKGVVESGTVPGLRSVLPAMVGRTTVSPRSGGMPAHQVWGQLYYATALAAGFALGFGGTLTQAGRFHLTNDATVAGLSKLVDLVRQFGGGPDLLPVPTPPVASGPTVSWAMDPVGTFNATPLWVTKPSRTPESLPLAYASFPRMPVRPIIPVDVTGTGLAYTPSQKAPPAGLSSDDLALGADFLLWLYTPGPQRLLADYDLPPVVTNAAAQNAFWAKPPDGMQPPQDWRRFVDYMAGWPGLPPPEIMYAALSQAVAEPGTLKAALTQAETAMNTWADGAAVLAAKRLAEGPR